MQYPSQTKMLYTSGAISNGNYASVGKVNLPKDLSIVNRRGYASTQNGVPWIFRVRATVFPTGLDGSGYAYAYTDAADDVRTTWKFVTPVNNWVLKNAADLFHKAQREMWKKAGVNRRHLGAYAQEIRYAYTATGDTLLVPYDGVGNAFVGGSWDLTKLRTESDADGFGLKLVGDGVNEESANTDTDLSIAHSYLCSKSTVPVDSNVESGSTPAKFSILNELLRPVSTSAVDDDVIGDSRDQGDNPPYDEFVPADVNNDITEPVEAGRLVLSPQGGSSGSQSVVFDCPFGIMNVLASHRDTGDDSGVTDDMCFTIDVLDIFPMQG